MPPALAAGVAATAATDPGNHFLRTAVADAAAVVLSINSTPAPAANISPPPPLLP
jgi:hypothetical protein